MIRSCGQIARTSDSNRTLPMSQARNSAMPTGGIAMPRMRLKVITMPNRAGSMPALSATGSSTGVKMMIAAVSSIRRPRSAAAR